MGTSEQEPIVLNGPEIERAGSLDDGSRPTTSKSAEEAIKMNETGQQDNPLAVHTTSIPSQQHTTAPGSGPQLTEYQTPTEALTIGEAAVRFDDWKTNVWDAAVNETRASLALPPWMPSASVSGRKRKATAMAEVHNLDGFLALFADGDLDTLEQLNQREAERRRKMPRLDLGLGRDGGSDETAGDSRREWAEENGCGHGAAENQRQLAQQPAQPTRVVRNMVSRALPWHKNRVQNRWQPPQQQQPMAYNLEALSEAQRRYQMYQDALQGRPFQQPRADFGFSEPQPPNGSGLSGTQGNHHVFQPQPRYPWNFARGSPASGWQVDQDIGKQSTSTPTAIATPPKWGLLQDTAATAAQLPNPAIQAISYARNGPALPTPPANVERRPGPQHHGNHAVGGDLVEATSRHDFNEIYRALYPTVVVLLQTKARLKDEDTSTWIRLNLRYREAWSDIRVGIERAQSELKPEDRDQAAKQYVPKRGALADGWTDYVVDWDMPYRGLGAPQARFRWLEYS